MSDRHRNNNETTKIFREMTQNYSTERNVQILVSLLKANGIRQVVASPGTANMALVISLQSDPFFQMYSAPDERSAAYLACGMAEESREPVVITCTGATASRNYFSALTEAFYRKLPILAVTGTLGQGYVGTLHPQVIDRSVCPKDTYCYMTTANKIKDSEDEWLCNCAINKALIRLLRHRQPVLIDLQTVVSKEFGVRELPSARVIRSYAPGNQLPEMPMGRVVLFIGAHPVWTEEESALVAQFCRQRGAVVLADHTANFKGLAGTTPSLAAFQKYAHTDLFKCDLLIHLGYVCGDYYTSGKIQAGQVWRVNEDGEVRDDFRKQTAIFQMKESEFFRHYLLDDDLVSSEKSQFAETPFCDRPALVLSGGQAVQEEYRQLEAQLPELPFSNIWMAHELSARLPEGSVLHLGILNSLRSFNFFRLPASVNVYSNVGGFGIDGCLSTVVGAALASPEKLFFCVLGDLAFFYDMNVLGNRHVPDNLRILLVNNGKGAEFTNYTHPASQFGMEAETFVAAGGHYSARHIDLVRHYCEDLGFSYRRIQSKEEFRQALPSFVTPVFGEHPALLEAMVSSVSESEALECLSTIAVPGQKDKLKNVIKDAIGEKAFKNIMDFVKK